MLRSDGPINLFEDQSGNLMKLFLLGGIIFGPLFYLLILIQMAIRPGFDITVHPISLLALGNLGWIQTMNFIGCGILAIIGSIGMKLKMDGISPSNLIPLFLSLFGIGLIIAAIFPADPSLGFPPGSPSGTPSTLSQHAMLHGVGFFLAFGSLMICCFILGRWWNNQRNKSYGIMSIATGIITPI
jgi:hypothetical protein